MLGLNAQLLGLEVNLNRVNLVNATLALRLALDPVSELVVDGVTTLAVVVVIAKAKLLLEITGKLSLAGLDSFLAHIHCPFVVLDFDCEILSGVSLQLVELAVATSIAVLVLQFIGAVLGAVFGATSSTILVGSTILLGLLGSPALSLVFLVLLAGLVLENITTKLEAKINSSALTTSLAIKKNAIILNFDIGFGVLAALAEYKLVDEAIEMILKLASLVGTIDDPTIILGVMVGHGTQLEAEVLDDERGRSGKRSTNAGDIDNNRLDTVAFSFNLGLQTFHLVTIESVADIAANIDERHDGGIFVR